MAAYGKSRADLAARWRAMIEKIELPKGAAQIVRERFRRRSIFHRPCPRAIARQRRRAALALGHGRVERAIDLLRSVCSDAPYEPYYKLDLARVLVRAGADEEASSIYDEIAADKKGVSSSLRADALMARAAIEMSHGKTERATELLDLAASMPLEEGRRRNVEARRIVLRHHGPAAGPLRDYFWRRDRTTGIDPVALTALAARAVLAEPDMALGHYLLGRLMAGRGISDRAAESLSTALDKKLPHPLLEREAARQLAVAAYRAGRYDLVERAAAILMRADQPEVARLYGRDWLDRVHWKRNGTLPE
jgi:hypothetical protein